MLNNGILEINKLNKDFYEKHAESFDRSRGFYWEIFQDSLKYLKNGFKVLDLGCGNARYLKFLIENGFQIKYNGIDSNEKFIKDNSFKFPEYKFEQIDILESINKLNEKYDFLVVFGVTHHLPSREFRKTWFKEISEMVNKNGICILSFWNFDKDKNNENIKLNYYIKERGDYFLGWKGDYSSHRFCHEYSEEEISEIKKIFSDFLLLEDYFKEDNRYLIFQKN